MRRETLLGAILSTRFTFGSSEHRNVFYGKHSFWPNGGINCIVDLDCTYGATYYLILGVMKGPHTYASINKLFNQPTTGVFDLLLSCVLCSGATLLALCSLANRSAR